MAHCAFQESAELCPLMPPTLWLNCQLIRETQSKYHESNNHYWFNRRRYGVR